MKTKRIIKTLSLACLLLLLTTSCKPDTVVGPQGEQGVPGQEGPQGEPGQDGISVVSIEYTSSDGLVDTYTITFSNSTTSTFTITNGAQGEQGIQGVPGQDGHTPIITIGENGNWFVDNVDTGIKAQGPQGEPGQDGQNGRGIISIAYTGSDGSVDTYIITYSDGTTSSFTVTNGVDGHDGQQGEQGIQGEPGQDGHTPIITIGENGNWFVDNVDTGIKAQGPQGNQGQDGTSVLTGEGEPSNSLGANGDSYIDLSTWNFYVKNSGEWQFSGNIKGVSGQDGSNGISIESVYIDDNGDLIVAFSDGEVTNAGHIKDVNVHTVKFYCDDLLVDTQVVKHGDKVEKPELEDFIVKHWYIDKEFEYEWYWYGCVVTENMSLYGDYQAVTKSLFFDKTATISIDSYGFGASLQNNKEMCVSKAVETEDYLTILESRGIAFNKRDIGLINVISIDIDDDNFSSATLYYGITPFSFENSIDLYSGNNVVALSGAEYFTIQNTGMDPIYIKSIGLTYETKTSFVDDSLPTVIINTKDSQAVTSRTQYVSCEVSTNGAAKDVTNLKAQIKVRGNSTAWCPKKPYRIKLDKKNSLFGYTKAKNWSLLAEYMDGSNMHNYTALKFAKMVRGENMFGVEPLHVNVKLNGENAGIYTFCEHIDAKEGRLNIEQDNIWEKSFDQINFYIERDLSAAYDSTEIEGESFFRINMENYEISQYVFALKYPEKEDFEEELEDGTVVLHEEEFNIFFNNLKDYMTSICDKFVNYYNDANEFNSVASSVDMESLAMFAVIDQAFGELDHSQKSFKMYRENGGLLKFGPNWDYDSCAYSLPYQGTYVLNPFTVGGRNIYSVSFGELWGYTLFMDEINGRVLFKNAWDSISNERLDNFIELQTNEIQRISFETINDCEIWMNNEYYCVFDNIIYFQSYLETRLHYLKNFYL